MTDLNLLTVRALRELAKKHLGTGYSRLKTKAELIAALSKAMPKDPEPTPKQARAGKPKVEVKPAAETAKPSKVAAPPEPEPAEDPAAPKAKPPARRPKGSKPEAGSASRLEELASKYLARAEPFKPLPEERKPVFPPLKAVPASVRVEVTEAHTVVVAIKPAFDASKPLPDTAKTAIPAARPVVEAAKPVALTPKADVTTFPSTPPASELPPTVKRLPAVMATAALPQTASEASPADVGPAAEQPLPTSPAEPRARVISPEEQALLDENLGDLPDGYHDDDVTLLARDPHTLWVSWDFARQTERRAREGMSGAMPMLRLYDGPRLVREVEIALEARSWYLYNVVSGHRYRAEIHFSAPAGKTKQLGPASNPMTVPPEGPSPVTEAHFVRLPPLRPPSRPLPPIPEPHRAPPYPIEHMEALMARAEHALREELPSVATPPSSPPSTGQLVNGVVHGAGDGHPASDAPPRTTQIAGEEIVRTRWLGSSDRVVERYRSWIAEEAADHRTTQRTRFGGRWTSSRPV